MEDLPEAMQNPQAKSPVPVLDPFSGGFCVGAGGVRSPRAVAGFMVAAAATADGKPPGNDRAVLIITVIQKGVKLKYDGKYHFLNELERS